MHKLLCVLVAGFLTNLLQPTSARSLDFFELPQFTSATHFRWADGEWIQSARTVPFYSKHQWDSTFAEFQLLDSTHTEVYDAGVFTLSQREIYTNFDNLLQHRETYKLVNDQWEIIRIDSFVYNTSEARYEQRVDMFEHSQRLWTNHIIWTHDAWFVHLLSKLERRIDPGPTRDEMQWLYEYHPNGHVSAIVKQTWNGSEWTDSTREVWTYTKDAADGVLKEITIQVYENAEWHNVEKIVFEGVAAAVQVFVDDQSVTLYPNPATTEFYLNNTFNQTLTIFDIHGREVKRLTSMNGETPIDVSDLSQGQYVVTITQERGSQLVKKLTIQR